MSNKTNQKRTFSLSEVAERLGVHAVSLRRAIREGRISTFRPYLSKTDKGKHLMCWPDLVRFLGEERARALFPEAAPKSEESKQEEGGNHE